MTAKQFKEIARTCAEERKRLNRDLTEQERREIIQAVLRGGIIVPNVTICENPIWN